MHPVLTSYLDTARQLEPQEAVRVLGTAVSGGVDVKLHVSGNGVEYEGYAVLSGDDGSHLLLTCEAPWRTTSGETEERPFAAVQTTSVVRVVFAVMGARYLFETRCAETVVNGKPPVIRLVKPTIVFLADRRRSPRHRWRKPTEVSLAAAGANDRWRCTAALLNVSPDGVACRVAASDMESLSVGQVVGAQFRLDSLSPEFSLPVRVTNVTEGGTVDQMVVGLEFIVDTDLAVAEQVRLREALNDQL
jgi:hypothetical protein